MKKIILLSALTIFGFTSAQVIIGDKVGTAPAGNKTSVLLEFANTNNKGIVLPYLRTLPATVTEGTIVLDVSTSDTTARVKYYNGAWMDLSGQDGTVTSQLNSQPTESEAPEVADSKAIIGKKTSTADGVLILESETKAMVLPYVDDVLNIVNPSPGMIVYVNKAGAKRLALFNGTKWSFWMP